MLQTLKTPPLYFNWAAWLPGLASGNAHSAQILCLLSSLGKVLDSMVLAILFLFFVFFLKKDLSEGCFGILDSHISIHLSLRRNKLFGLTTTKCANSFITFILTLKSLLLIFLLKLTKTFSFFSSGLDRSKRVNLKVAFKLS